AVFARIKYRRTDGGGFRTVRFLGATGCGRDGSRGVSGIHGGGAACDRLGRSIVLRLRLGVGRGQVGIVINFLLRRDLLCLRGLLLLLDRVGRGRAFWCLLGESGGSEPCQERQSERESIHGYPQLHGSVTPSPKHNPRIPAKLPPRATARLRR